MRHNPRHPYPVMGVKLMARIDDVDAKIDSHVDQCALRYEGIGSQIRAVHARLKRIETIMISAAVSIIGLLTDLVLKGHGG